MLSVFVVLVDSRYFPDKCYFTGSILSRRKCAPSTFFFCLTLDRRAFRDSRPKSSAALQQATLQSSPLGRSADLGSGSFSDETFPLASHLAHGLPFSAAPSTGSRSFPCRDRLVGELYPACVPPAPPHRFCRSTTGRIPTLTRILLSIHARLSASISSPLRPV